MIQRIRAALAAVPFAPFTIVTTGGSRYRVLSHRHAQVSPRSTMVNVWFDDDGGVPVPAIHIAAVEVDGIAA